MIDAAGTAHVRAVRSGNRTRLTHVRANSPVRLLTPRVGGPTAWLVSATFGGGLVGGDCIRLDVDVDAGARILLTTQASTKVYRSTQTTRQELRARVGDNAMVAVLPDPIVAYAGARFEQRQRYMLEGNASLVALDWMTSGRHARGEHWQFDRYASRIEIAHEGREIFFDHVVLDRLDGELIDRMRTFTTYGLIVMHGTMFHGLSHDLSESIGAGPLDRGIDLITSIAPIDDARGAVVRFAATDTERAFTTLREMLRPVVPALGDDPWARRRAS